MSLLLVLEGDVVADFTSRFQSGPLPGCLCSPYCVVGSSVQLWLLVAIRS